MESLLDGTISWTNPIPDVEAWLKELKYQCKVEDLKEEAKNIGLEITHEEFRRHFRKRKESMESSKSGRYMGYYKVALENFTITTIHLMRINIPLLWGFSEKLWCKSVNVMVSKDPGIVKLNRMRIKQI